MAELKTKQTESSVADFLNTVEEEQKRMDCFEIVELMQEVTGEAPKMWGPSIVGCGKYHYKYDSGHEGDSMLVGLSPRKQNITMYLMGMQMGNEELLQKLGKYKTGKGCLYVKKLTDIDKDVLKELMLCTVKYLKDKCGRL